MPKRPVSPLVNGRVRLRLLKEADLPMTLAWRNQDRIRRWFLRPDVITPEQHETWFRAYRERDDDFVFLIEETETLQRPVGQVSLYRVDEAEGRAEFGRLMIGDPAASGKGLAKLATAAVVTHAFDSWGLHEVYLEVLDRNTRALRVYAACGFQETDRGGGLVHMLRVKNGGIRPQPR